MLFETIRIEDGRPCHLSFHEKRLNRSRQEFFPQSPLIDLQAAIVVPQEYQRGLVRCRVDVALDIERVQFSHYQLKVIKKVVLVESSVEYLHKFSDRAAFDEMLQQHPNHDEVIVTHNGFIRDATIANVAFLSSGGWYTPDTPLLLGTTRARLIVEGGLVPRAIHRDQLKEYERVLFFNAMRGFDPNSAIPVTEIECFSEARNH